MKDPTIVTWHDALFEFESDGEPPDGNLIFTIGWITGANDRFLTLAGEVLTDGSYRSVTSIPLTQIVYRSALVEEGVAQ